MMLETLEFYFEIRYAGIGNKKTCYQIDTLISKLDLDITALS